MQTDEELFKSIKTGDNDAFRELISLKEKMLYSVAFKILRNKEDAEDAAYETFEELCVKIHAIKNPSALTAWLITTVKRKAFDILRKNSRTVASEEIFETQTAGDPTEAIHIGECLKRLSDDRFEILSLYAKGLKLREIAELTGKPITTVWSTLKKAQADFKKLYEK